ncbi:LysR family transcriptional regulator [Ancylobacter defluvii]|uniref:LysR family transcriptional regulator n=1 Tax=Ancylobacter defluvii TaxID=1282440 RepID=A0A9W6JZV4_9HYPH|nr:LysR family transcriptional regulator [Ancylobacter defluvii]MBS7588833.1 LysR family transcriptional regulator [Ancylobacter defluvii]GLK86925.1 LysR family transcriptional regulator [Ancylobacter defluvii]
MDNRAGEMQVLVEVADRGSFSAAGRALRLSPSAVSKIAARIEARLGVRLLLRSTRALVLTAEGEAYVARARAILAEIEEAERQVAGGAAAEPRGRLRVSASVAFGEHYLVPLVPQFLARHPRVSLDLSLTDSVIDLLGERTDLAIRIGPLRDSSLKARRLSESRRMIVAAPAYLDRHGVPATPDDLDRHNCLRFNFRRSLDDWPFRDPVTGAAFTRPVGGNFEGNSGTTLRRLALEGLGLARIGAFHIRADIEAGTLVPVLEDYNAGDIEQMSAVYVGHAHLDARIRAFVDFLAERIRG